MLSILLVVLVTVATAAGQDMPAACQLMDCGPIVCPFGAQTDQNGCTTCVCKAEACQDIECPIGKVCEVTNMTSTGEVKPSCSDPMLPADCRPLPDTGSCKGLEERWYYDTDRDMCDKFNYGMCAGNDNRFETEAACAERCRQENRNIDRNGCSMATCLMFCPEGFKKDGAGCNICQCADKPACPDMADCNLDCPKLLDDAGCPKCACEKLPKNVVPDGCPSMASCDLVCPTDHAYKVDSVGCPICECVVYNDETYTYYYEDCPEAEHYCDLSCQFGFEIDGNGCPLCDCSPDPSCPPIACPANLCQFGHRMDENGCETCTCRTEGECHSKHPCKHLYCQLGFQRDQYDCNMCFCNDPCFNKQCGLHQACHAVLNTTTNRYYGACAPDIESHQWCDMITQCRMYCEHGFTFDRLGCPNCSCLNEARPACDVTCDTFCPYGRAYDTSGCKTCECLSDPCKIYDCSPVGKDYVCESQPSHECDGDCPATPNCVGVHAIKRARVELVMIHEGIADLPRQTVADDIEAHISEVTGIDGEYIVGVYVEPVTRTSTRLVFHVVAQDNENIKTVLISLEDAVTSSSLIVTAQEIEFQADKSSISTSYSTDPEIWEDQPAGDDMKEPVMDTQTLIIIGAAVAAAILIVGVVFMVRAYKRNNKTPSGTNYTQASQSEKVEMGGENIYNKKSKA